PGASVSAPARDAATARVPATTLAPTAAKLAPGAPRADSDAAGGRVAPGGIHLTKEDLLLASLSTATASHAALATPPATPPPVEPGVAASGVALDGAGQPGVKRSNHLGSLNHGGHDNS